MAKAILQRFLKSSPEPKVAPKAFTLPGMLHDEVRLLFISSGDLTDLLFAIPFISRVRETYPRAHVGLVCDEDTSQLALTCDCFQDLVIYDEEQMKPGTKAFQKLEALLRKEDWEAAVLLSRKPDAQREALAFASGATLRLGPGHEGAFPSINCELRTPENGRYPYHRTATWGRLLGVSLDGVPLSWPLTPERQRQAAQLVHFNKPRKDQLLIGIDPGIGKEGTVFAPQNLAFLVNHLASHVRCKTMLLTADLHGDRIDGLTELLRSDQLDLPRTTLREMLMYAGQCDLFLSGNTDLFHYTASMGVPCLSIFTPRDQDRWVPEGSNVAILRSQEGERLSLTDLMGKVDELLG